MSRMRTFFLIAMLLATHANAYGGDKKQPSIKCTAQGHYIGNVINPIFKLTIDDAKKKTWLYTYNDDFSGTRAPAIMRVAGTYEVDGDLAIFTGRVEDKSGMFWSQKKDIRFGVNYGFHDKKVFFDRFFPDGKGQFHYHRKWFKKGGKKWLPAEERRFSFSANQLRKGAPALVIAMKYEIKRWRNAGPPTITRSIRNITFKKVRGEAYEVEQRLPDKWLPAHLRPHYINNNLVSVAIGSIGIAELRGFHPKLALAP